MFVGACCARSRCMSRRFGKPKRRQTNGDKHAKTRSYRSRSPGRVRRCPSPVDDGRAQGRARPGDAHDPGPAGPGQGARRAAGQGGSTATADPGLPGAAASTAVVGAPAVAPGRPPRRGAPDADKARIEIYGQVMLDAIYDFKRMNPRLDRDAAAVADSDRLPGQRRVAARTAPTIFSIRQSSLGFRSFIPTSLGMVKTDLASTCSAPTAAPASTGCSAWAEIGMYGVGQTYSNFMDIDVFPNTIDYWGPPRHGVRAQPAVAHHAFRARTAWRWRSRSRRPTRRSTPARSTEHRPELGAGLTGWNRLPDLVASFRFDGDWGHVAPPAILRQVGFQNPDSPDGNPSGHKTGYGLNLSGALKALRQGPAQLAGRRRAGDRQLHERRRRRPGAGRRACAPRPCSRSAGWLYYNHAWTDKWSSSIGF